MCQQVREYCYRVEQHCQNTEEIFQKAYKRKVAPGNVSKLAQISYKKIKNPVEN